MPWCASAGSDKREGGEPHLSAKPISPYSDALPQRSAPSKKSLAQHLHFMNSWLSYLYWVKNSNVKLAPHLNLWRHNYLPIWSESLKTFGALKYLAQHPTQNIVSAPVTRQDAT